MRKGRRLVIISIIVYIMNVFSKALHFFENGKPTDREIEYALLAIRIIVAVFFIKFGYGKLFGAPGIEGFTGMLIAFNFPLPVLFAYLVGSAEFFGGIAILFGVATRFSAFWLTIVTFAAWAGVKGFGLGMGMALPDGRPFAGGALDWVTLGLTIALFIAGPGALSLSAYMKKKSEKNTE